MPHHNRHFAGDRYALSGAWSPPTSSANFCEEDYVVSIYIAEFINSLTNLAYVYLALRYMYGPGSRGPLRPRLDFMSVSLLVLGLCSFLFHASLRQTLQFADELGMLGVAWSLLQGLLTVRTTRRRTRRDRLVDAALAVFFPLFAGFYVYTGEIVYHFSAFFLMVVLVVARGTYLFYWREPAFPPDRVRSWRVRGRRALVVIVVAFVLWNVDLELCAEIRALRERVGLPWAWLLELHGWWHVMTAYSTGEYMDLIREVQEELKREKSE